MAEATARLKALPLAASAFETPLRNDVRRTLLPRTQYWLYFVAREGDNVVTLLAVWHTARGSEPAL